MEYFTLLLFTKLNILPGLIGIVTLPIVTEIQQKFKLIQKNNRDHYSQQFVFDWLVLLKAANNRFLN